MVGSFYGVECFTTVVRVSYSSDWLSRAVPLVGQKLGLQQHPGYGGRDDVRSAKSKRVPKTTNIAGKMIQRFCSHLTSSTMTPT